MPSTFWIKTAGLFLIRSGSTTIVLSLMVVSAVSSLVFLASFAIGINDAMINNSVRLFSGHITGTGIPDAVAEKQLAVNGVSAVLKRKQVTGFIHARGRLEMITLIAVDPAGETAQTALRNKTVKGSYLTPGSRTVYLNRDLTERLGIEPKDVIGFSTAADTPPVPVKVAGIYHTGMEPFDRGISFCTPEAVPRAGSTWNAAVFLEDGADMESVVEQYRTTPSLSGIDFKTWPEQMPALKQLIDLNYLSMGIVTLLVFIVISFGIACAFSIVILKNKRIYGIMKVMGVLPGEMVGLIAAEVVLVNLAASALGMTAGAAFVWIFGKTGIDLAAYTSHNPYFIVSGMIYPRLTLFSLCLPPVSALAFSLPAAVWPAVMVIRARAADILRSV